MSAIIATPMSAMPGCATSTSTRVASGMAHSVA
jgi:hypothetical protein